MQIESTHLGKESKYPQHYDPSVLVAVPRILNREKYGITNGNLPFSGVDVWHAYEFSFLLKFGAPVVGILKIIYSSNNEYLVESKSLKLYLNSFNMENYGKSKEEGINEVTAIIKKDLSVLLGCDVGVYYFIDNLSNSYDFSDFTILENEIFFNDIVCNEYFESPDLLMNSNNRGV
jgi:7-cyano-7-deazaguanine reductase